MRNIFTIFIASPSDLKAEREKAFEVVDELNESLKATDWAIDLLGWEDTLPGYGRPQALINRDVERCDLFIGLLWRKWGTPPAADSTFSSGFEEEFSIAKGRRERGPSPELWMFFKAVDPTLLADAGPDLQRVIAFRDGLIAGKSIFFKEFGDTGHWERELRRYLFRHVINLTTTERAAPEGPTGHSSQTADTADSDGQSVGAPEAGLQLSAFAQSLAPSFASGDIHKITAAIGGADAATFMAVRGLLLSAALVAASGSSTSLLPTHELNTLFRYREQLKATDEELYLVVQALLADAADVNPGWYWLASVPSEDLVVWIIRAISFDTQSIGRIAGLRILRNGRIPIPDNARDHFFRRLVPRIPVDAQPDAWSYIVEVATDDELRLLLEVAPDTWLEPRTEWLAAWLQAERDLGAFLNLNPSMDFVTPTMQSSILANVGAFPTETLQAVLAIPNSRLRDSVAAELNQRGLTANLPIPQSNPRRWSGVLDSLWNRAALQPDTPAIETDHERYARLSALTSDSLKTTLSWYDLDGPPSYRILAERGDIPRTDIQQDLATKFQRTLEESQSRWKATFGTETAATIAHDFEQYRESITREFSLAALTALSVDPTGQDAAIAREFLDDDITKPPALRIVSIAGDSSDVPRLIELAGATFDENVRRVALEGAERLSNDRASTARTLIKSSARQLRRAGLSMLAQLGDQGTPEFFIELLSDEDEAARLIAVDLLRRKLDTRSLTEVLNAYTAQPSYYYNVVTWLDRILFTHASIMAHYDMELVAQIRAHTSGVQSA